MPGDISGIRRRGCHFQENAVMKAHFPANRAMAARPHLVLLLGALLSLVTAGSARADLGTPEQKRACTPDVYRLCAGEIPNVRAIVSCLRRQKSNLSEGCRAVFER
jgi:hypothetical protein